MPIKIPKGFARRKSSGNVLGEVENPPEPSFRVIERSELASKSFDAGLGLKRRSLARPLSAGPDLDTHSFAKSGTNLKAGHRDSGGTHNSVSSGGLYDNSSSSARFSSSSTLPSSNDITPDEDSLTNIKDSDKTPFPTIAPSQSVFSLRAAGRTFSFGRKPTNSPITPSLIFHPKTSYIDSQESLTGPRDRALTESSYASASTATPSKFFDRPLDFEESDLDDFGNMFDGLGRRGSRERYYEQDGQGVMASASPEPISSAPPGVPAGQFSGASSPYTPPPTNIFRLRDDRLSRYSTASHGSQDELMTSFSPPPPEESSFDYGESPPVPRHAQGVSTSRYVPLNESNDDATNRPRSDPIGPTNASAPRRSSEYFSQSGSSPMQDEDAKLLMYSPSANREWSTAGKSRSQLSSSDGSSTALASSPGGANFRKVSKAEKIHRKPVASFDSHDSEIPVTADSRTMESAETTPKPKKLKPVQLEDPPLADESLTEAAELALRFEEGDGQDEQDQHDRAPIRKGPPTKVMTPIQFERYRKEQEAWRKTFNAARSEPSDDESDRDEDEDDAERNRQLAKQRRQQEAHLAVYRQQMMKVTGEKPTGLPSQSQPRIALHRASISSPNLPTGMSSTNLDSGKPAQGARNSDDEDEDIPLGILAAHGFPSKTRSPTAMGTVGFSPSIRFKSETYPPPPASIVGESMGGRPRSGLPVFARNLPPDPYYGASLVKPSNRESLAFGNNARSTYGGTPPQPPPGGLVGVIAGEERAKALRRGSPNVHGGFGGDPNLGGSGMPQMQAGMSGNMSGNMSTANLNAMGSMGMPGSPGMPMMTPGDQAQIHMSQQMNQMMQMQMQWMQQMQQMVQMQGGQPGQQQAPPGPPQHQQMMSNVNGHLLPPGAQMSRPMSLAQHPALNNTGTMPMDQRPMSMPGPSMSTQWPQQRNSRISTYAPSTMAGASGAAPGYTPSIAPSERSNIGMPSRYRPVSTVDLTDDAKNIRKSSGTSSFINTLPAWSEQQPPNAVSSPSAGKTPGAAGPGGKKKKKKKKSGNGGGSDEDDDEGWEEMRRSRERKKSSWRLRKLADGQAGAGFGSLIYQGT